MTRRKIGTQDSRLGSIAPAVEIIATSRLSCVSIWGNFTLRIRTVKPEFWKHPVIGRLPGDEKALALGLLNMADDEGFFLADPLLIRSEIMPYYDGPLDHIHGMISDLSVIAHWMIIRHHKTHGNIGMICNFKKHQKINRPKASKLRKYFEEAEITDPSVISHGSITAGTGNREQGTGNGTGNNARTRATKTNDDFELFWKSYPKKVGKKDALKAFQKARKSGLPEIGVVVASIEKQRKSDQWRRDNGQYIPNPSTWLNQGRWDDELQEGPGRKLTVQELAQREISEWLEEEEAKDGTEDSGLLFAGSGRIISGEVVTDKADEFGMVKNVKGH